MWVMQDIFTVLFATLQTSFDLIFSTFNSKFIYLSSIFLILADSILHWLIGADVKADYDAEIRQLFWLFPSEVYSFGSLVSFQTLKFIV